MTQMVGRYETSPFFMLWLHHFYVFIYLATLRKKNCNHILHP